MTTYVRRQVFLKVSEDQNGQRSLIQRGDVQTRFDAVAELEEGGLSKFAISIPAVDVDLMEGSSIANARILLIETDTELTVKLDDVGDTGITVKPLVDSEATTKRGTLYLEGDFTHVYVSIAGSEGEANVIMGVVGA